jgi:indolepyruvate ferredoxin oxidoreductase beta subunit
MELKSIIICGVGGQGILLASDVLSDVLIDAGYDVKKSEVHGMSQRGGDVVSTVRYGDKVFSPIVGEGEADMILAFERLEALRTLKYLKKDGKLMINDFKWDPMPVATGTLEYPEDIFDRVKRKTDNIQIVDAVKVAEEIGNIRVANIYLLGVLAKEMDVKREIWDNVIKRRVPEKAIDVNLKAFDRGYSGN